MKLHELRAKRFSTILLDVDIWDRAGLEPVNVDIDYEFEPSSHSDHPYGEGTAREDHPATVTILKVKLVKDANIYDDEKVVKVLKSGTDLMKEPFYTPKNTAWLEDQVKGEMGE